MTAAMDRAMNSFTKDVALATITALSEKYGFPVDEAVRFVGVDEMNVTKASKKPSDSKTKNEKKVKEVKAKFAMPWTGDVKEDKCKGIKDNSKLFTQCTSNPIDGERFCLTCKTQAETNGNGKPSGGTVEDRLATGPLDYKGPKNGAKVISYANFLLKKNISHEDAKKEAERLGIEIPDYQWDLQVRKRGRPSKPSAAVSDTSSGSDAEEASAEKPKKKTSKKKKSDDSTLYDAAKKKASKKKASKKKVAKKEVAKKEGDEGVAKIKEDQASKMEELTKKHLSELSKKKEEIEKREDEEKEEEEEEERRGGGGGG